MSEAIGRGKQKLTPGGSEEKRLFRTREQWAAWLEKNHQQPCGIWLRIAKKGSGLTSVSYAEALEVALCYGWIDGQKRPENEQTWLQRFGPRTKSSLWSKVNREKALALIECGEMKAGGLQAIEQAKRSGRWDAAYDSASKSTVPDDLDAALQANAPAKAFFEELDKTNRYSVIWRVQTARTPEGRARKIEQLVAKLGRREKFHP